MALLDNVVSIQKRLAIILVVAVVLIVATVALLRVAIVRPITCAPNCIGANLLGSDLRGLDLARTNFVEANLQGADLRDANLRRVDLSGANLFNANLRNADLSEAQLIGTNLTGADLGGSLLSGANLTGAILNSADLTAVDLTEAALKGASFGEAKLTNAQLSDANLNGIQFAKANLSGAILDGATLSGANLSQVDLSGASLRAVDLTGSWLNIANLTGADLSGADLSGSRLIGAQLTSANLSSGSLQGATVIGATLNGANLRGANVQQLRGLATQLQPDDLRLDPVLAELNELQQRDLRRDVEMQGLAFDAQTEWDSRFRPAEAAVATPTIIASTVGATDETGEATVAAGEAEKHVKINFYVNALRNAPAQPGAYEVDFTVDTFWNEPGVGEGEVSQMATDQFFDPFLEIVNAGQVQMLNHRYERSIEPGTTLRLRQRFVATFSPALDLRRFPFDRQTVSLQIESAEYDSESLQFDFAGLVEPMTQSEIPQVQSVPRGRYIDGSAV
ncbi:MAG: pentapeptide repeat-containing protein, partial [Caldilineaceae bacterium]|nr:pentapeptide repeat-containing protein [Caldilineaceae bacterium]